MRIGIMSAMPEENNLFVQKITRTHSQQVSHAQRTFTTGFFNGHEVILAFSRWGKVAAAITSIHLLTKFEVDVIIFTGVAGACSSTVNTGDIVIADNLIQHDMDARPIFSRYEIPLTGIKLFEMNGEWKNKAYDAAKTFLRKSFSSVNEGKFHPFGITQPRVHQGQIASGDRFFASESEILELQTQLPHALCVEMEGAAVAQVCHEYQIPCTIIRTISDNGNENSPEQFQKFVTSIASCYSLGILKNILLSIK